MLSCQNDLEEIHSSPGSQLVNGCRGKPVTETSYGQVLLTCALLLQSCSCQEIVVRAGQLLHAPGVLQIQGRQLHHAFTPGSAQHQQQWHRVVPPKALQPCRTLRSAVVTAASSYDATIRKAAKVKAASSNAMRVRAAFAEAGLSQDAIDHILTQYPHYLGWDVEQKLLPAMQQKRQEIGVHFPSEFERTPKMLLRSAGVRAAASAPCKAAEVKATSVNASRVKCVFAEAGLSQHAIHHILTKYPRYMRWDVEQKLLPAMQQKQQELGATFVSEFERIPTLLIWASEQELSKDQYLASIGIKSVDIIRRAYPHVFQQSLTLMQRKVGSLQACGVTETQIVSLVQKHPEILNRSSEHVNEVLRVIDDLFGCAQDKDMLVNVLLSCRGRGVWQCSPLPLHNNFLYYCSCIVVNDKQMQKAWKHAVFRVSPAKPDNRLNSIALQLSANLDEAKAVVRKEPSVCTFLPATVGLHISQLHELGFSHSQVKRICLRQPTLLALSYDSDLQASKWAFLTCVLQLSHDAIVARPLLLMSSLPNRLGPRWGYLQQLRLHGVIVFSAADEIISSLTLLTDSKFKAKYTAPSLRVYDNHFQQQWQKRWNFLLVDQQLSVQDIAKHPALLQIPLKDTGDLIRHCCCCKSLL